MGTQSTSGLRRPVTKSKRGVSTSLPAKKIGQVSMKELEIDRLESLEVEPSLLIPRGVFAIDVVVVEGQRDHIDAVDPELDTEPFRKGRLARRRRASDGHELNPRAPGENLVRDLSDLLLVQSFRDTDDVAAATVETQLIELADILDPEKLLPASRLHVGLVEERARSELRQVASIRPARKAQQETVFERHDAKGRTASGVRSAGPVGEIDEIAAADGVNSRGPAGSQQLQFVVAARFPTVFLRLFDGHRFAHGMGASRGEVRRIRFLDRRRHLLERRDDRPGSGSGSSCRATGRSPCAPPG